MNILHLSRHVCVLMKYAYYLCHVRPSACMCHLSSHLTGFHEIWYLRLIKVVEKHKIWYSRTHISSTLREDLLQFIVAGDESALFKWNGRRLLGYLKRCTHCMNKPQYYDVGTFPIHYYYCCCCCCCCCCCYYYYYYYYLFTKIKSPVLNVLTWMQSVL